MVEPQLSGNPAQPPRRSRTAILLGAGVIWLAFMTSHGSLNYDSTLRLKITQSLVEQGDTQFRISPDDWEKHQGYPNDRVTGPDGLQYLRYHGIGQSLIFAGPYYIFHRLLGIEEEKHFLFLISMTVFPVTLGLTAWIFFLLLGEFGFTVRQCFTASLLLVFATGLWELAKEGYNDAHIAFFFGVIAYGLRRYEKNGSLVGLALSAVAVAASFITRLDTAVTIACYLGLAYYFICKQSGARATFEQAAHFLLIPLITIPAFVFALSYNVQRFDHPVSSYSLDFTWPVFITGLKGLLVSPGKSLFLYNPVLLLALPGVAILWKKHRAWTLFIVTGFTGCLLLHAAITNFHGSICWGPRYLCRYFPLLFIPLTCFLFHPANKLLRRRVWIVPLILVSFLVQTASVSLHFTREHAELAHAYNVGWTDRQWTMFEPEAFFLKQRLGNLVSSVNDMAHGNIGAWDEGAHQLTPAEKLKQPSLNYLAFWPFHLTYYLPAVYPANAVPLWGSTLVLALGLLLGLFILRQAWRRAGTVPQREKEFL